MELSPDIILHDRYRIIRQLGKGGMGAVYLAFDNTLEHEVAVKSNLNPSESATAQFLREARLLAKLRHPNLPRVNDHFVEQDQQFLVMDYIPGDDLGKLLEKQNRLPLETVINFARQLGDALTYLHNQDPQVIHRDIKPANIKLMTADQVILVDFGIAKSTSAAQVTSTGATGYTPGYAPPEQYGGARTGSYSDQYSFAATIYQLLTGVRPVDSVQRLMGEAILTPLNILLPDLPQYMCAAIERALSLKPEERFSNIVEFINALTNPHFTPTMVITRPVKKNRALSPWIFVGIGAFLLAGLTVLGGIGYLLMKGTPTPTPGQILVQNISPTVEAPMVSPSIAPNMAVVPTDSPTTFPSETPLPKSSPTPEITATQAAKSLGNARQIAFASDRADGKTLQLWSMKVEFNTNNKILATDLHQLTSDAGNKSFPAWSPDGKTLIFSAPGPGENGLDLWLLNITDNSQAPLRITNIKGDDTKAAWSPNSKFIAFTNRGRYQELDQLYIMNVDGSNLRKLSTDFEESDPTWSPDMSSLIYVIHATNHLYLYQRNKSDQYATPKAYDPSEIFGRLGEVSDPTFSPDGLYVAYTRLEGYAKRIWSLDYSSKGAKIIPLTMGAFKEDRPSWAPDGQWIVFSSERDNNPEIYIMTSTGLMQTNLSNSPGKDIQPAWQP